MQKITSSRIKRRNQVIFQLEQTTSLKLILVFLIAENPPATSIILYIPEDFRIDAAITDL